MQDATTVESTVALMNSAESKLKVAERAARTAFLTNGVALMSAFLTSEGLWDILWPTLGAVILGVGVSGLVRRGVRFLLERTGAGYLVVFSLALSAVAALLLGVFPVALGLGSGVGMSMPAEFVVEGVILTLASLANLVVLLLNIALLARREPGS